MMQYYSNAVEMLEWTLEMDLKKDIENIVLSQMQRMGISPSGKKDIVYEYFNLQKKLITMRPRAIKKSKEFNCPAGYKEKLESLERDILQGNDLNKYQGKGAFVPDFSDGLLNDWNIVHFHLENRVDPKDHRFVARSDYLLFAWVSETAVYFIRIYRHKEGFSQQELVKIISQNWPELLRGHVWEGRLTKQINDEEYSKLRKHGVSTFVQINDHEICIMLGGGYSSDGSSTEAVRKSMEVENLLLACIQIILNRMWIIIRDIRIVTGKFENNMSIKVLNLILGAENRITLVEESNQVIIQLVFQEPHGILRVLNPRSCKISVKNGWMPIEVKRIICL